MTPVAAQVADGITGDTVGWLLFLLVERERVFAVLEEFVCGD